MDNLKEFEGLAESYLHYKLADDAPDLPIIGKLSWELLQQAQPVLADIMISMLTEFGRGCILHIIDGLSHGEDGFNACIERMNIDRLHHDLKLFPLIDGLFIMSDPVNGTCHMARSFVPPEGEEE